MQYIHTYIESMSTITMSKYETVIKSAGNRAINIHNTCMYVYIFICTLYSYLHVFVILFLFFTTITHAYYKIANVCHTGLLLLCVASLILYPEQCKLSLSRSL